MSAFFWTRKTMMPLLLFTAGHLLLAADPNTSPETGANLGFLSTFVKMDNPASIAKLTFDSNVNGEMSLFDLICLIYRKGNTITNHVLINFEGMGQITAYKNFVLSKGTLSIDQALQQATEAIGCKYKIDSDGITIWDPKTRELGANYPLDAVIDDLDLKNVGLADAVSAMAKKLNMYVSLKDSNAFDKMHMKSGIVYFTILSGNFGNPGPINLHLHNVSVRNALNKIYLAAGCLSGWRAETIVNKSPDGSSILVLITN